MAKANKINMIAGLFTAFGHEQIVVNGTVKRLTEATYKSGNEFAKRALITVEDAQIRYKYNGDDPSTTSGHLANRYDTIIVIGTRNIRNFRVTKVGTTNGELNCTYEA